MTLGQLAAFLAVARTGSVRAAAAERVVSEAAVSAAVASLERELGAPLVERHGRGLRLTRAGESFARHAAEALAALDRGRDTARALASPGHGHLRIAAVNTAGEHVLPELLGAFRRRWPAVEVSLEVGNRARVVSLLRARDADLAISGRPPATGGLAGERVLPNEIVLVASRGHPLARRRRVTPEQLEREVWLLREEGSGTRETTLELFRTLGISPPQRLTLGSNGAVKQAALAGLGVTLLSRAAVGAELRSGRLCALRAPTIPLDRPWYALYRAGERPREDRPAEDPAGAFLALLRSASRSIGVPGRVGERGG